MHTIEVEERGITLQIPEHWDEMTPEMTHYILSQAWLFNTGQIGRTDFIVRSFYKMAGIKRNWRSLLWERLASPAALEQKNGNVSIHAEFFTKFMFTPVHAEPMGHAERSRSTEPREEFTYNTVLNHLTRVTFCRVMLSGVEARSKTFHGPAHILSDLTFGEFRAAMEEMNDYFREKQEDSLNRMIACLYRPRPQHHDPEQHSGRIREPFNRARITRHAAQTKKFKPWQKMTILLWFTWCISYIQKEDLIIEGRTVNLSPLFPKPDVKLSEVEAPPALGLGWTGILFGIAKEGVFGDIQQTDQASLFDVLLFMYDNHLQAERLKSK